MIHCITIEELGAPWVAGELEAIRRKDISVCSGNPGGVFAGGDRNGRSAMPYTTRREAPAPRQP
jgi:hypothetical protein